MSVERMCTEKAAFLSKDEANRAKHVVRKTSGKKVGIYECPNCHCWHLTSQIYEQAIIRTREAQA